MLTELTQWVPLEAIKLALVLALSFLVGIEREEEKQRGGHYAFGGVRSFPLIGLFSYALALVSSSSLLPWTVGLAVIGGLMAVSYYRKVSESEPAGVTSELSGLGTYLLGALVQREYYWIAGAIAVISLLLLELKEALEGLAERIGPDEILTAAKFLLVTVVILPIVPNREFTSFQINPFKTWLVVVAVTGVSYCSYLLQRALHGRGGVFLSALLGGVYSSTATSVVLARQSKEGGSPNLFTGCILAASGMMYARLAVLIAFFNAALAAKLAPAFAGLASVAVVAGWLLTRDSPGERKTGRRHEPKNPLGLNLAFLLALAFVVIRILTGLTRDYLGSLGMYALAIAMGAVDVDPFILGLAQSGSTGVSLRLTASAILIAAASNNVAKGIYAYSIADKATGRRSLVALTGLAALGLIPMAWM